MNADMILRADLIDLVFESRNKEYGAYELRKLYRKHLFIAITGPVLILFVMIGIVRSPGIPGTVKVQPTWQDTTTIALQPPPAEPLPPRGQVRPPAVAAAAPLTNPVLVTDDHPTQVVEIPELGLASPGIPVMEAGADFGPPATSVAPVQTRLPAEPAIYETAEEMPEFPGGLQALSRFMSKNLKVPDEIDPPGTSRRVVVNFVVSKDGSLESVHFRDSIPLAYEQEIRRVFMKMPAWTAGSQHGRKVAVYYHMPIVFQIPEE